MTIRWKAFTTALSSLALITLLAGSAKGRMRGPARTEGQSLAMKTDNFTGTFTIDITPVSGPAPPQIAGTITGQRVTVN